MAQAETLTTSTIAESRVTESRVNWVDTDKGLSIILVVARHSAYGVAASLGHVPLIFGLITTLSLPYRMPLFFVIAGLFAASALKRPLREFLDKKLVHFAYFYFLWSVIQIGIKVALPGEGNHVVTLKDLALTPIQPFGTLWFIYALPLFFMMMRLFRDLPKILVIGFALAIYFARIDTGWTALDETGLRFVFFAAGVYGAPQIFQIAAWARANVTQAVLMGTASLVAVGVIALTELIDIRIIELLSGVAGCIGCVMLVSVAASKGLTGWLAYMGSRSLYVFVAFFLPMAASRVILIKLGVENGDLITLVCVTLGVALPLVAERLVRGTWAGFLFTRPDFLRLKTTKETSEDKAALALVA